MQKESCWKLEIFLEMKHDSEKFIVGIDKISVNQ